jgi:hypothetical protein
VDVMAVQKLYMKSVGGNRYLVKSRKIDGGMLSFKDRETATKFNRLIKRGY